MQLSTGAKIGIGLGIGVAILIVVALIVFFVWYVWPSSSSSAGRLATPMGEMTAVAGPYHAYNAIPGETGTGHIYADRYPEKNLYAKYGYRAVHVKDGEVVDRPKSSEIKWNDLVYKVMTYNEDHREDSGFTFKIPEQKAELIEDDIDYELVSTIYDNLHGTGTPLYKELILGRVNSEEEVLEIVETDDKTENKVLIS